MNVEITEEEAQRLIESQRREIAALKAKLSTVGDRVDRLLAVKAQIPEEFLKAATDLAGRYFGEHVNQDWLDEMHFFYSSLLKLKPHQREKLPLFGAPFLFAVLGAEPVHMENVRYGFRQILETLKKPVLEFLK